MRQQRERSPAQERAVEQLRKAQAEARFRVDCFAAHLAEATAPCAVCGEPVRGALPDYPVMHERCAPTKPVAAPEDIDAWFAEAFT